MWWLDRIIYNVPAVHVQRHLHAPHGITARRQMRAWEFIKYACAFKQLSSQIQFSCSWPRARQLQELAGGEFLFVAILHWVVREQQLRSARIFVAV